MGVGEGSAVEIDANGEELLLRKRSYDLDELIAQMSEDCKHAEQDRGPPGGAEEW